MNSETRSTRPSEETLVRQAIEGDLDAFNQLVLTYQDMAYNHARGLLGDPMQAEDVTQESFIKAFQSMNSFRGGSFRSWLLRIITNSAYDVFRRSKRHPTQPLFPEDENGEEIESAFWLSDPSALVHDIVEQKELSNDLFKLVNELPIVYQTVLALIDIYELDYTEAADALKIPIGTVKSRLARARLRLSEKLCGTKNTPLCLSYLA